MLYYVRGDGGMAVIPVEEVKRWIESRCDYASPNESDMLRNEAFHELIAEMEAMGT